MCDADLTSRSAFPRVQGVNVETVCLTYLCVRHVLFDCGDCGRHPLGMLIV